MNLKGFIAAFIGAMFEAAWAYGLKHSGTNLGAWGLTIFCVACGFYMFYVTFKYLGPSITYIVFTGLSAVFVVSEEIIETLIKGDSINLFRIIFIITLIIGILGLKADKKALKAMNLD